jgi:hypothetical protein
MGNRMPQNCRNRKISRAALCAVFGIAVVLAGSAAVYAGDDDEMPDTSLFKKFLRGFGLRNGQEAGIEYKERPPLVVPSNSELPPPVSADAMTVHNPAWPSDPDEKKRADERRAKRERKRYNMDPSSGGPDGNALSPSQLAAGKTDQPAQKDGDGPDHSPEMTPSQLGYVGTMWSGMVGLSKSITNPNEVETKTFVREPSRNALTDPPVGYRTPSPVQPYGINSKQDKPKATAIDRQVDTVSK